MNVIETIADLRKEQRAEPFWIRCGVLVYAAEWIRNNEWKPRDCGKELPIDRTEADRLWQWMNKYVNTDIRPTAEEILVRADCWRPQDGTHRASAAYVLGIPVPATVVEIPKPAPREWYFNGIWKWR